MIEAVSSAILPPSQSTQTSCAGEFVYFPGVQSTHEEAPSSAEAFPAGQSVHVDDISEEYLPVPQVVHEVAPEDELYFPASQLRQSDRREAPGSERYCERRKKRRVSVREMLLRLGFSSLLTLPASHSSQVLSPWSSLNFPAGHVVQYVEAPMVESKVPAGQAEHVKDPGSSLYFPVGQASQESPFSLGAVPAGQTLQVPFVYDLRYVLANVPEKAGLMPVSRSDSAG